MTKAYQPPCLYQLYYTIFYRQSTSNVHMTLPVFICNTITPITALRICYFWQSAGFCGIIHVDYCKDFLIFCIRGFACWVNVAFAGHFGSPENFGAMVPVPPLPVSSGISTSPLTQPSRCAANSRSVMELRIDWFGSFVRPFARLFLTERTQKESPNKSCRWVARPARLPRENGLMCALRTAAARCRWALTRLRDSGVTYS